MSDSLAVVVLTLNEAKRLERCLQRIPDRYPVFIVDSGSSDGTLELAGSLDVTIISHPWAGFAGQRNFALAQLREYSWCLFIDADELYSASFFENLPSKLVDSGVDVYEVSSRLCLTGSMLRYAPGYPIYHPRLVRTRTVRFIPNDSGHGETVESGLHVGYIDIPYEHHFADDGPRAWLQKHLRLAEIEANAPSSAGVQTWRARLSKSIGRGPLRPLLRFLFHYVVCQGFRDGRPGLIYSLMYTWFELTKLLFSDT